MGKNRRHHPPEIGGDHVFVHPPNGGQCPRVYTCGQVAVAVSLGLELGGLGGVG
jgi:hypothetical protein